MSAYNYQTLLEHVGHKIEIVTYGRTGEDPVCVSCECLDCNEVIISFDNDEDEGE